MPEYAYILVMSLLALGVVFALLTLLGVMVLIGIELVEYLGDRWRDRKA